VTVSSPGPGVRRIALVAHDNCKQDMLEWAACNRASADFLVSSPLLAPSEPAVAA
jgi:methylglyoxal synthase